MLVTDAALLVEAGAHLRFDRLVVVHCDPGQQLERLRARDGLDERAALARIDGADAARREARLRPLRGGHVGLGPRHGPRRGRARRGARRARGRRGGTPGPSALGALLGGVVHGPETGPRGLAPAVPARRRRRGGGPGAGGARPPAHAGRPRRPWYETAGEADPGAAAANLAVALAAWALCRGAADRAVPRRRSRARSPGSPTRTRPRARTRACSRSSRRRSPSPRARPATSRRGRGALEPLATRFGGAPPTGGLAPVWAAVRARPARPGRGARRVRRAGAATRRWRGRSPGSGPGRRLAEAGALQAALAAIRSGPPERDARARATTAARRGRPTPSAGPRRGGDALLHERVPLVAVGAAPQHVVGAVAAGRADVRVHVEGRLLDRGDVALLVGPEGSPARAACARPRGGRAGRGGSPRGPAAAGRAPPRRGPPRAAGARGPAGPASPAGPGPPAARTGPRSARARRRRRTPSAGRRRRGRPSPGAAADRVLEDLRRAARVALHPQLGEGQVGGEDAAVERQRGEERLLRRVAAAGSAAPLVPSPPGGSRARGRRPTCACGRAASGSRTPRATGAGPRGASAGRRGRGGSWGPRRARRRRPAAARSRMPALR